MPEIDDNGPAVKGHSHLWNDLPFEERQRLMPFQIQCHIDDLKGARRILVNGHKKTLQDLDAWIGNLEKELAPHCGPKARKP